MRRKSMLYRMIATAALLCLGLVLPFLTGQLQTFGKLLSPLHIPVFVCGLTCGWLWGGALGALLPVVRMMLFGMPAAPMAYPMTFELCVYGVLTGVLYPLLTRLCRWQRLPGMLASMALAMVAGRLAGGAAKALLLAGGVIAGAPLTFEAFLVSYFVDTAPGALVHFFVVPAIVLALEKARLSPLRQDMAA